MASQGKVCRGGGQSNNQQPSDFDQQAFIEVIGATTTTIAQASAVAATIAHASAIGSQ